jgi:hypothetical protein
VRILVVAQAHPFVNPTRELLLSSLGPEFVVVGPGYGPVLNSVAEYIRACGPFDGLVLDAALYLSNLKTGLYKWPDVNAETFADLFDHFDRIVVLNLLDDFHGSTPAQFKALFDPRVFVLSTTIGLDNFRYDRFMAATRETWCPPKLEEAIPRCIPPAYLLFPAALADDEFLAADRPRRDDVAVLGVQYFVRRRVAALMKAGAARVVTGDDLLFRVLRTLQARTGRLSGTYRRVFLDALDRAKVAVTCSGTVGYPIRKFFEIPARRAALVAEFFDHPEALGFRSGENCVALLEEDASDAPAIINHLLADDGERERIAAAGYDMVWSRHRMTRRVEQLRELMESVVAGDLVTARWDDGRMRLIRRSDPQGDAAGASA